MSRNRISLRSLACCAVFAALTAVCSQIQIPLPVIPINLALFAVHLAGAVLGWKYGTISIAAYMLLGAVGVPVFANFSGGLGVLLGNTGGYVVGYVLCALTVGLLSRRWGRTYGKLAAAMVMGAVVCYLFGTAWYMILSGVDLWKSLTVCVLPFLPGDVVKILLAALLARRLQEPLQKAGFVF